MKNALVVTVLILAFNSLSAQQLTVQVFDSIRNEPLSDATVYCVEYDQTVLTNAEGKSIYTINTTGCLDIKVMMLGYRSVFFTLCEGQSLVKIYLLPVHLDMHEVTVSSGALIQSNKNPFHIESQKMSSLGVISNLTLGEALAKIPGVYNAALGNGISKPVIRGLSSNRVTVFNQFMRVENQQWGAEHGMEISGFGVGSVEVIKGPMSVLYGSDAIGGVVLLNPKNPIRKDSLFGSTIAGFQTNGKAYNIASSLHKTYKNGYFLDANATHKRFGDFRAPDYFLTNTGSKSTAFSLNVGYKTFETGWNLFVSSIANEIGILGASHIGGIQDLVNALNSQQPLIQNDFSYRIDNPKQDVTHFIAKASYFKRFQNVGKLTLQ